MARAKARTPDETVTVLVPLTFRRRGGRKRIVVPEGQQSTLPVCSRVDCTLVKALARAHRWRNKLESRTFSCIAELAQAERINSSYLCRVLRLTLLAPDIVEACLDGRQPVSLILGSLMKPFPAEWHLQRVTLAAHG